ncbi:MAG: hypothetical protein ACREO4_06150 [Lysobacter sp.]
MAIKDRQLTRMGPWPRGVNNLADEQRLPRDDKGIAPVALREADNIDLDAAGVPKRRRGHQAVVAGTLVHSLWGHDLLPFGLYVDDGTLHSFGPDESVQSLGTAVGHLPLSYELIGQFVYYCNTIASGLLTPAMESRAWSAEHPAGQPGLELVSGLGLDPGQYQLAITFVDDLGRESGSTLAAVIEVPAGHGIRAVNIPQPLDAATALINVYLTDANDQVLRRHTSLPAAGITDLNIGSKATGKVLDTQFLQPMPAGQITRLFNGRQLVARGNELLWSEPLRYGMFDPARGRMRFAGPIDVVAPIDRAGVMVAAGNRTYWLGGADPDNWALDIAYAAGGVPGSHLSVPGTAFGGADTSPKAVWLARDGQIVVGAAGSVQPMKLGEAAIDNADRAAPLFRAEGGMQQLVMGLRAPQRQSLAVTDTAIAHVIYAQP